MAATLNLLTKRSGSSRPTRRGGPGDAPEPASGGRTSRRRAEPRPPRRLPRFEPTMANLIAASLIGLTLLILAFGGFLLGASKLKASREQDVLYSQLTKSLGEATVPVSGAIPTGTPLGILEIPKIGVEQVFLEGSASEQTAVGPGLRHDSSLPGQAGLSVIVGRRATFGAPFADLDRLEPGDRIEVTTGQGEFTYVVDLVRTSDAAPTQIRKVDSRLTLVTSDPAITPNRTLTVSGVLQGEAQPKATGTATVAADAPGEGSSGHLVALLLWSQLLLLVALTVTWAATKVPGRALWIGAVPVLIALLWNVYTNLAFLLPNTL
ncbi:sortase [Nocardioides fonticola]|uniref:Sortase n=2 Tax=Nocardioides fonticola TaxID=450363 RepID=A0ABP7XIY4_9ACTN